MPFLLLSVHAMECQEPERVLFYGEENYRAMTKGGNDKPDAARLMQQMIRAATKMEEPDTLVGYLQTASREMQANWDLAMIGHQMEVLEDPANADLQVELLNCQKKSGQFGT